MGLGAPSATAHLADEMVYLRGALNSTAAIIYTVDCSFQIMTVNAAWDEFAAANDAAHLQASAVVGTNLLDWIRGPIRDETRRVCELIFSGELARYANDFDCSSPDHRRIFALTISPLHDTHSVVVGASFVSHDITERKLLEEQLSSRNEELHMMVAELRRQHAATERERDRAQSLGRVIATVNQSLSTQTTVDSVLAVATHLVQAPAAAVYLLSDDGQRFLPCGSQGIDLQRADPAAFEFETSVAGHVLRKQAAHEITDSSTTHGLIYPRLADGSAPQSLYVVPIPTYDGPIGVLEVYAARRRSFDAGERSLLATLAAAAGIALTNAALYDEQVRRRQEAEQSAHTAAEHAAQLDATIGAMADGVWMCDSNGRIITINDAALHMFGLEREYVVGQSVEQLERLSVICHGERPHLGLKLALRGETVYAECGVELPRAAKELIVDICATPIADVSGAIVGAVAVVRDITDAKAMDRVKEDFLSIAAHELKTPITALKGYAQLALKRIGDLPEVGSSRRFLETIDDQADRINGLVQKLLDVSRIHAGKLDLQWSRFDLYELVEVAAERAQMISPIRLTVVEPRASTMVTADMPRIEQVLYNLIDNAIKYSPDGGTVRIAVDCVDDNARVVVHDQGMGIPSAKLPYIFDRWYQAHYSSHGDYGGMGLGLYICKEIVERHGGTIWARSDERGGSSIGFTIPLRPPAIGPSGTIET